MASPSVGTIVIGIRTNVQDFQKEMGDAAKGVKGFEGSVGTLGPGLDKMSGGLLSSAAALGPVGIAIAAGTAAITAMVSAATVATKVLTDMTMAGLSLGDDIGTAAANIGTTASNLTSLKGAAEISDVSMSDLETSLKKMNAMLGDAVRNTPAATKAFKALGLDARQLIALDPADAFLRISDALSQVENQSVAASMAQDIFGKGSQKMIAFMTQGSAAIQAARDDVTSLGFAMSDVDAKNIDDATIQFDRLKKIGEGLSLELAATFAPAITDVIKRFIQWYQVSRSLFGFMKPQLRSLIELIALFVDQLARPIQQITYLTVQIAKLALATAKFSATPLKLAGLDTDSTFANLESMASQLEGLTHVKPGTDLLRWFDDVNSHLPELGESIRDSLGPLDELDQAWLKMIENSKELVSDLEKQIATFGMSSNQVKLWELAQQGANRQTLNVVQGLISQLDAMERNKKAQEEFAAAQKRSAEDRKRETERRADEARGFAKSLFDSTRTPMEKFQAEAEKIRAAFKRGDISRSVGQRALFDAASAAERELAGRQSQNNLPKFASTVELGSQQAREIALRQVFGGDKTLTRVEKLNQDQLTELRNIKTAITRQSAEPEVFTLN